jgi:CheY-like chemotaxis protein
MKSPAAFRKALIVETNFLVASVIEAPLVAAGYAVAIATNADEAFAVLATGVVSLALIDFRLQHGGPDGLVAALSNRNIPFIFCTAASLEEVYEHFPNARVVPKPFSDEALLLAVSELVAHVPAN